MADIGDKLNDDQFFGDIIDTPKEGTEKYKKREELKNAVDKGKLGHKRAHVREDKASGKTINKTYAEYKQRELNQKGVIYTLRTFLESLNQGC